MSPSVCQITYEYPPRIYGGLGRHVGALTAALPATGWHVSVATLGHPDHGTADEPRDTEVHRVRGIPVIGDGTGWRDAVAAFDAALPSVLAGAATDADVLHAHDWFAVSSVLAAQRARQVPLVVTVHATERGRHQGHLPSATSVFVDAQERRLATAADAVIVCSTWMRDFLVATWELPVSRITVIPNGTTRSDPAPRDRAGVLFAGRLEHEKGGQVLLHALAHLLGRGVRPQTIVAGDGSQAAPWAQLAGELGVAGQVRFVGRLDDAGLTAAYQEAAVVVVPSLYEPFGMVAAEALTAGAPLVATDVGGLRETVGEGGVLVPAGDAAALADALQPLLEPGLQRQLAAQRAAARAAHLPTWPDVAAATAALYTSLTT